METNADGQASPERPIDGGESGLAGTPEERAWLALQRLMFNRFRPRMVEIWREYDLGPPHQLALRFLSEPRPMGEIAQRLQCDNSHMTGIVDRLEERGLVERRSDPADRRVRLVALTAAGEDLKRELGRRMAEPPPELSVLDEDELEAFAAALQKIAGLLPGDDVEPGSLPPNRWG